MCHGLNGLASDVRRQAVDSLRGYDYQIWHTLYAWLSLAEDEFLFVEAAEDFDIVSSDSAVAVQVKATRAPIQNS